MVTTCGAARQRIGPYIRSTPLVESGWLSERADGRVSLKLEKLQFTGSFKVRGALNAPMQLPRGASVVAASAGNHGRAIAHAAKQLGISATVFTPRDAPRTKVEAIRRHGAVLDQEFDRLRRSRASGARILLPPPRDLHVSLQSC